MHQFSKFPIKVVDKLLASYDNRVSNEEIYRDSRARQEDVRGSGGAAPLIFNLNITYRMSQEEGTKLREVFLMLNYAEKPQNTYIQS
jgi:hypothetical protein